MFNKTQTELALLGADITTAEIKQEPELWPETLAIFQQNESGINSFLNKITAAGQPVRVLFTGAGTSAYVGNTVAPYLNRYGDRSKFRFEAVDSTKLVSSPHDYLEPETTTLLVSFARSGDSPESVAAVDLAEKLVKNLWQLTITCNPAGHLAQHAANDDHNFVLLQPARSNDRGFAMTGSFSCMALSTLLIFDQATTTAKAGYVQTISAMGQEVIDRETEVQALVDLDFNRIIYLGSGPLGGLTEEARLKVLELTAGKIATLFDTSMGFRHGPKSFVDEHTLVFDFISNDSYSRLYDSDILAEVAGDKIALQTTAIGVAKEPNFGGNGFIFAKGDPDLPDGYLALPDVMFAQTLALLTSVKIGNTPDTPSATGTVNRVVKGVTIHPWQIRRQ